MKEIGAMSCRVASGTVISRVAIKDVEATDQKVVEERVLMPKAIAGGIINEELGHVFISQKNLDSGKIMRTMSGDVVLKLTTPYDVAYITNEEEGIIISSHCAVIRDMDSDEVDARYLASVLSSPYGKDILNSITTGAATAMLKVRDILSIPVPMIPLDEQNYIGELYVLSCKKRAMLSSMQVNEQQVMDNLIMRAIQKGVD